MTVNPLLTKFPAMAEPSTPKPMKPMESVMHIAPSL
jgi:hypothetical protein